MRLIRPAVFFLVIISSLTPFSLNAETRLPGVVVTIKPLHSLVAGVMGETGAPELLVSGNASPHEFQLKPSQMKVMADANVIFYTDDSFETFLHNAFETLPAHVRRVAVAQKAGLTILSHRSGGAWEAHAHQAHEHEVEDTHHHHEGESEDEHAHEDHHEHRHDDMHVWLDPDNARKIIALIVKQLSIIYPAHQEIYEKNAEAMIARLDALDDTLKADLSGLQDKPFIVFHDAYQYLERHYGLSAVGSITFEPEESPSPKRLSQVREKLKETKAVCVFREPYFSERLVTIVTEGSQAQSATLDPEATALEPGPDLYFTLLENLAKNIKECLEQKR